MQGRQAIKKSLVLLFLFTVGVTGVKGVVSQDSPAGGPKVVGYVPGEIVVNFKDFPNPVQSPFSQAAGARPVTTGWATVDALNTKYNVTRYEKLFPGENSAPTDPRYADLSKYYILRFPAEVDLDQIASDFRKDSQVITADKDAITRVDISEPNDPRYTSGDQWPAKHILDHDMDLPEAWDYERGDSTVILGIIDTGILRSHTELGGTNSPDYTNGNVWINWPEFNGTAGVDDDGNLYIDDFWGWDFVSVTEVWPGEDGGPPDNDPKDFNGHGTHVSGIAAAVTNNGIGLAGVAGGWKPDQKGCKVMALRVGFSADDNGTERGLIFSSGVGPAVNYARNKGVTAINMSFGYADIPFNHAAIRNALLDGMIVVHSAGNDNNEAFDVVDTLTAEGTTNQVISVASTSKNGTRSSFSTYGTWVDVSAPGGELVTNGGVWSTYSNHYTGTYAALSGTSMSSPHVVGLAGLMKSNFPDASGEEIYQWIVNTAVDIDGLNPGYEGKLGSGLINANNFFSTVPVAKFGITPSTRGHVPFAVTFEDSSTGGVDSLFWDFGDGGNSTSANPTHLYNTPGRFTVKQYAWDDSFGNLYNVAAVETKSDAIFVIADSIYFGEGHAGPGDSKIPVLIYYQNVYPVTDLTIPIKFNGVPQLSCDSVSFTGGRIAGFLVKSGTIDNGNRTILIQASGVSALSPGNGLLATAYFSLASSATVGDSSSLDSAIVGGSSLEVVSTEAGAGSYDPKFINGFLAVEQWKRGDVNKSGALDLGDVISVVNHIFKSTPAPDPYWLGDFSANGTIELVDVLQMVNRILKGI